MNLQLPAHDRPTQVQQPIRSTARSSAATLLGAFPVIWPLLVAQVGQTTAVVVLTIALAGNALVARLLAVPSVEMFLRHVLPLLAAKPPERERKARD